MSTPLHPPAAPEAGDAADRELAARVQSGDAAAFEALFRRYFDRLAAFAEGYVRAPEAAEDLTVDVFVRIWERRAEWNLRGTPRSYLYTAVRNEALAWLRRRRMVERAHAESVRDGRPPAMGAAPESSDAGVEARELAEAADHAILQLPERSREAFVLLRKHGLSYAEIAETMGISVKTVEVHLGRAFKFLRAQLAAFLAVLLATVLH
ncbi:MAG TPA: RNA polymerase sigma-70 factor [Longimicrobium sp.]